MFYIRSTICFELLFIKDTSFFFMMDPALFVEKSVLPLSSYYIEMMVFTHHIPQQPKILLMQFFPSHKVIRKTHSVFHEMF